MSSLVAAVSKHQILNLGSVPVPEEPCGPIGQIIVRRKPVTVAQLQRAVQMEKEHGEALHRRAVVEAQRRGRVLLPREKFLAAAVAEEKSLRNREDLMLAVRRLLFGD